MIRNKFTRSLSSLQHSKNPHIISGVTTEKKQEFFRQSQNTSFV